MDAGAGQQGGGEAPTAVEAEVERRQVGGWLQAGLGCLVVLAGIGGAVALVASRQAEEKGVVAEVAAPVEVVAATPSEQAARIESTGVVVAARQVTVVPQVGGRLTMVSAELQPGGRFAAGEVLARVEAQDYQLAVEQRRSAVHQAEVELQLEQARQQTAAREWELLGGEGAPTALAGRQPQLRVAESGLASAQSQLRSAQLSLERTTLRAPFDAIVISESAEEGQVVGTGAPIATLVGTESLWVQVSVPVERLGSLDIPGANAEEGSAATVTQSLGAETIRRQGRVLRLSGQLDEQSRTATVLVEVADPLNLQAEAEGRMPGLPLLPGAFVEVVLEGRAMPGAIRLPRVALEADRYVWVVEGGRLARREVQVAWGDDESVVVTGGLAGGEQVVVTPLSFPIEGMAVSVEGEVAASAASPGGQE